MTKQKILITGLTGFIGRHLAKKYLEEGNLVFGNTYDSQDPLPKKHKLLKLMKCDVKKFSQVQKLVKKSKPDLIFHLAAQPYPWKSWQDPKDTFDTNVNGTLNLFSAIMKEKLDPKILIACSSAEYGHTAFKKKSSLKETDPLLPVHPYGLSKVGQDLISYQYYTEYGLKVIRARIFNTIGPGKKNDFVGDVSQQISKIRSGLQKPIIKVGNLHPKRDVTDVRDQVLALDSLIKNGKVGEVYNVCSGRSVSIEEILNLMLPFAGKKVKIKVEKKLVRKVDEPLILGNPSKIKKDCFWKEQFSLKTTLRDSINYWDKDQI